MPTTNLFLVTQSLRRLLDLNVRALLFREGLPTTLSVTAMPPERVGAATRTINLHLYHLMEDAYYKNLDPPGRGGVPTPTARQPLTLLLYYVMTAHHEVNDVFDAEIQQQLMGLAMKSFHDHPVIGDNLEIAPDAGPPEPVFPPAMAGHGNQIEVSLRPLTPEEALSFWSAEQTSTTRLSAYYEARTCFLEPEPPAQATGIVTDLGLFVVPGRPPILDRTMALSHFVPPPGVGMGPRTMETSPARATLCAPGFNPPVNRVNVEGSGLTGDGQPGSATLVLRTAAWAQLTTPVASARIDAALNPAWNVEIGASRAGFDVLGQLDVDDGSGIVTLEVTPGIYAVSMQTERRTETTSGVPRVTTAASNQLAFSVGARIDGYTLPPGPNQRIVLRVVNEFDLTTPGLDVQLAIDGLVYLETDTFANNPVQDQGLFRRQAGGVLELHPLFDATLAGAHPVRLVTNGAESQPFWIETP